MYREVLPVLTRRLAALPWVWSKPCRRTRLSSHGHLPSQRCAACGAVIDVQRLSGEGSWGKDRVVEGASGSF